MFCKILDLPKVPTELVTLVLKEDSRKLIRDYPGWEYKKSGERFTCSDNPFFSAPERLIEWIHKNILDDCEVGIRYAYGTPTVTSAGVHTDQTRDFVLQYHLKTGGGKLCYWVKKGGPLFPGKKYSLIKDYNDIDLVESHAVEEGVWHLVDARLLHSVEDLNSTRITIQLSLNQVPHSIFERTLNV